MYACLVLLSHLNISEERKIKIENKREKINKYMMKCMSMVIENEVRMSANEDFCVLLFYPAIATKHT